MLNPAASAGVILPPCGLVSNKYVLISIVNKTKSMYISIIINTNMEIIEISEFFH
ncbi:hypothetical protein M1278_00955 [Candidatus Marsarchaeota archaeon]|nr:hypothetical protein [Candidatus Marsarchaeota archaeon]